MNVAIFGATGMIGQAVLRECLLAPDVQSVLSISRRASGEPVVRRASGEPVVRRASGEPIVRRASGQHDPKLHELLHKDFYDFSPIEPHLSNLDACFFCLGITSAGLSEAEYRRITYDITLAAARSLLRQSPNLTFIFTSGVGTDSTGRSRTMWARVKGQTENALLGMPFRAAYMFRPGVIVPLHGIKSRTRVYQFFYTLARPILPWMQRRWPHRITTTEKLGQAMLKAVREGAPKRVLEPADIAALSP